MKAKIDSWTHNENTAVFIEIPTILIVAGQVARINIVLTDENGTLVYAHHVVMPKDKYDQWGTDDSYIFDYVAAEFNPPVVVTEILAEPSKINLMGPAPKPGPTR